MKETSGGFNITWNHEKNAPIFTQPKDLTCHLEYNYVDKRVSKDNIVRYLTSNKAILVQEIFSLLYNLSGSIVICKIIKINICEYCNEENIILM